MAVQYIPKSPATPLPLPPVRRSTRHITFPPTPSSSTALPSTSTSSSPNGKSSRVVTRSPSTNTTRRPRRPLTTTISGSPTSPTPTSVSGSRSRKRSRFQDEPDQKEQDLAMESFPSTPSPRTRLGTIIDNRAPITPEPTPRAIRAQKRRRLTDSTAEADTDPATASDSPSSSSSPLSPPHSLSPTTPHPHPTSPEPISPAHSHLASPYIVKSKTKSRSRKRKVEDDGASLSSDPPTPPSSGDPLPRSLAKRRKMDRTMSSRQRPPRRIKSKSKSSISSATPPTPLTSSKKRTSPILRPCRARTSLGSVPLPRGVNNVNDHRRTKNVRRSARLLVHTSDELQPQFPSEQSEESLPLSPLTPPPSEDDASESGQVTNYPIEKNTEFPPSLETQADPLVEEEDDTEMEMIACIGDVPINSSSICASAAQKPMSPPTSWIIPSHISNPVLTGRPPPNPALYTQLQLASYRRTKPNTPSPLSLYSYTGVTPPTSPALSAATINSLDAIDDIPPLGGTPAAEAIAAIAEGDATLMGLPEQLFHEQQQQQMQFYSQGYSQVESPQPQQSVPGQVFDQPLEQPQQEYRPPAGVVPAPSPESSDSPPPSPLDMNFMIDLQFQMQFQHIGMQSSANEGMHFGVDQLGFVLSGNAAEERNDRIPTTVHMQDVHLHQQPQNQNHQQSMDVQPNHQLFGYPYFSTEQQGQMQQGSNQLYETQEFDAGSQSFQGQPEYQQQHPAQRQFQDQPQSHHQEQPQTPSSSYEAFGGLQPYQSGSPQFEHQHRPHQQTQQDFQIQQQRRDGDEEVPPSTMNIGYDAGAYQTPTQTTPASVATPATSVSAVAASIPARASTTPIPHYTLSMHNALLFFQQSHSRFHEDQAMLAHDAGDVHTRQLEEFQRDKEERKRRLKRTKLVRDLQVVPMGSSAAGLGGLASGLGFGACPGVARARGLWAVACKARMFEVVRIYTPALIREVTEISAREYYRRMGLKYPCRFSRYRRRMRSGEDDMSISEDDPLVDGDCDHEQERGEIDDVFDGLSLEKKDDGDADGEEFRNEKIFDFELLDDDEECEEGDEEVMDGAGKQIDVDVDEEMDDDEEDDEDDDGDDKESLEGGVDLDLEAIRDPFFQPELSMRIAPQEPMLSTAGGVETAFYVPPPEVYAVSEQNVAVCEDQTQEPASEASTPTSTATATLKQNQKQKYILFHRPVVSLPPPALSTFRPAALKFYNVDPVHVGRGTPCVKERREVWAGGMTVSSLSFCVKQVTRTKDGGDAVVASGVAAWYYGVQAAKDASSSRSSGIEPGSDPRSVPPPAESDDSVFGDCVGTCCADEKGKGKGKMKAVEVEVEEEGERGEGKLEEELPRGEEEAHGEDDDGPSTSTALPEQSIAQPPLQPQPTRHMTVEIPPALSDRIPHRRRGILGRTELLKVYAPPSRSVPPILPLARRPPRPPPHSLGLGLDETESNSAVRSLAMHHHPPVVPYSWEQVAEAMELLAFQGIDASVGVDGNGHPPSSSSPLSSPSISPNGMISGTEVQIQPTFNPSSSELSAALG